MTTEKDPNGLEANAPGAKLDAGKNRLGLVLGGFSRALEAVGHVGTFGAQKYSPNGWKQVENGRERYEDALMRHYLASKTESHDPQTGLSHLAHLAWNALAVLELELRDTAEREASDKSSLAGLGVRVDKDGYVCGIGQIFAHRIEFPQPSHNRPQPKTFEDAKQ